MALTTILFDLDGTLLPMDQEEFIRAYFHQMAGKLAPLGYEPQKLMDAIWTGTAAMIANDGRQNNETVFWNAFCRIFGPKAMEDKDIVDSFYLQEFQRVQAVCPANPQAAQTVHRLQDLGLTLVLATNPIFPAPGTHSRIRWAGLTVEDFALCTTYENSRFSKPNLNYYRDILQQLAVSPEECLMVGNDVGDDMVARELGMEVFLLTDCLINQSGTDIDRFPHGSFPQLMDYVRALLTQ